MDKLEAAQVLFPNKNALQWRFICNVFSEAKRLEENNTFESLTGHDADAFCEEMGLTKRVDCPGYKYKLTDKGKKAYARWLLLAG